MNTRISRRVETGEFAAGDATGVVAYPESQEGLKLPDEQCAFGDVLCAQNLKKG